jgi:hypothetical protein
MGSENSYYSLYFFLSIGERVQLKEVAYGLKAVRDYGARRNFSRILVDADDGSSHRCIYMGFG